MDKNKAIQTLVNGTVKKIIDSGAIYLAEVDVSILTEVIGEAFEMGRDSVPKRRLHRSPEELEQLRLEREETDKRYEDQEFERERREKIHQMTMILVSQNPWDSGVEPDFIKYAKNMAERANWICGFISQMSILV